MASAFTQSIKGDRIVWMVVIMLFLFSILAVFSSSSKLPKKASMLSPLLIQSALIALGFLIIYIFHNTPISLYRKFAITGVIISIALLAYMLIFGTTIKGARRWVNFFVFTFQPADVAKVALIIYLAKVLEEGQLDTFKKVFTKLVAPVGIICALIIIVDTSTAVLIGTCCLCVMFIGGVKTKYILNTIGIALISLAFIYLIDIQFFGGKTRINTVISRVLVFSDKDRAKENPDAIIQPNHAKAAVASGGIIGKGPGNSTQRHVLEEAYSDYIYAIIVEEYGLIGGMTILMAYLWLLFRAVMIAKKCSRIFPIILVLGLSLMIVLQAVIHMGVSVGVLPVTGLNLPLVSRGGTSIVFTCLALGITLAVSRTADNQELSLEGLEQDEAVEPQKLKA